MNNPKFYTIDCRTFKQKVKDTLENAKVKAGKWIVEHKEEIIFWSPIVVGLAGTGIKTAGKIIGNRQQKNLKDLYCYDPRLGHYWRLRREPTNNEWLEIDRRRKRGERLSEILDDMRILK